MKAQYKILTVATMALMGSYGYSAEKWSTSSLSSYGAGDKVELAGKTYQCKPWPASGWCSIAAYKPNGTYGSDAWEEVAGDSSNNGGSDSSTDTPTDDSATNSDGSDNNSGSEACPAVPEQVEEFKPQGPGNWNGYSKDAFVRFEGAIYKLTDWWTASSPQQNSDWKLCEAGQAQEKATLSITINRPSFISEDESPSVVIFKNENSNQIEVAEVTDAQWNTPFNLEVPAGDLQIFIPAIDGNTGSADTTDITLAKNETKSVEVNYQQAAPAEEGSLSITFNGSDKPNDSVHYKILDNAGNIVRNGYTDFSSPLTVDNLPASDSGTKYKISFDDYIQGGYKYSANDINVTVYRHNTSDVNFEFAKAALPTQQVSLNVSGLPEDKQAILTLANDKGQTKEIQLNSNKDSYNFELPSDDTTYQITLSTIVGYSAFVSANSIFADSNNSSTHNLSIEFREKQTSDSNWPDRVVVGYVRGYDAIWKTQPDTTDDMISKAADHGYNVFVYSFAGQKPGGEVFFTDWKQSMIDKLDTQIPIIHNKNGIALLAIGGAVNFFDVDMSGDKAISGGKAMAKFLADYGFDGLDIDVEHPNASATGENFLRYLEAMREEYQKLTGKAEFVTAAPQITGHVGNYPGGNAKFAEKIYTQSFMDKAKLDAVFVQTYNQYGGAKFLGKQGTDVGFLTNVFNLLSEETRPEFEQYLSPSSFYVPADTKIVLGVPNYRGPNVTDAEYNQGQCMRDATCSGVGIYDPVDLTKDINDGKIANNNQYGGVMTWILNSDEYQNWTWVDGVKNVAYN